MRPACLLLALVLVPLAGCGSRTSPEAPQPVTYQKVGGIAGTRERITVGADGRWRHEALRLDTRGRLTGDQRAALGELTADPGLNDEAARTPGVAPCADGYQVSVTVGQTTVLWAECGPDGARPPVAARIARLLVESTG
jgi:hypothetical protein